MLRSLLAILLSSTLALAANQSCPTGTLGATDTVTARGATALVFQGVLLTSTPTVTIQICCVGACDATGNWAAVSGGAMALTGGTPTMAIAVANPACMYRATTTGGTATVGFACSGP